jgi:hypothetical protein
MMQQKSLFRANRLTVFFLCLVIGITHAPTYLVSQQAQAETNPAEDFNDEEKNNRRIGGAGRGGACELTDTASGRLTAFVPSTITGKETTINPNPTIWFYVPYASRPNDSQLEARFTLLTEDRQTVEYKQTITLPESPSFIEISLPSNTPLERENWYNWHFTILCDRQQSGAYNITTQGWIGWIAEPINPDNLLYDRVDSLMRQRCDQPDDANLKNQWESLLTTEQYMPEDSEEEKVWLDVITLDPNHCLYSEHQ